MDPDDGGEVGHCHRKESGTASPRRRLALSPSRTSPVPIMSNSPASSVRRSVRTCACSAWVATTRRSSMSRMLLGRSKEETFTTDVADAMLIAAHVGGWRDVTAEVVADGRKSRTLP